jgi:putative transposase
MNEISNVVPLRQPNELADPLTNIVRAGARQLLAQAVEIAAETFLAAMKDLKLPDGRDRVVRHGHGPTRPIQTGIGPVVVERVKIRDREAAGGGERVRFTSADPTAVGAAHEEFGCAFAALYLRGISTGDFQEALAALLGQNAPNLSPAVIPG